MVVVVVVDDGWLVMMMVVVVVMAVEVLVRLSSLVLDMTCLVQNPMILHHQGRYDGSHPRPPPSSSFLSLLSISLFSIPN